MDHVSFLASLWCTAITEMVHADYRNGASHLPNKWCTHLTEKWCIVGYRLHRLSISDNGRGFPPEYDPYSAKSLGMTLLRGFSEQLDGKLVIGNNGGVSLVLTFKNEF